MYLHNKIDFLELLPKSISPYFSLTYVGYTFHKYLEKQLKTFNISVNEYNLLIILNNSYPGGVLAGDLSAGMLYMESNASRIVFKLLAKGFLRRKQHNTDVRCIFYAIVPKGILLLTEVENALERRVANKLALNKASIKDLDTLLNKLKK